MKRIELMVEGLVPFGLGLTYMLIGMLLVTTNKLIISLLSIGCISIWGYFGYEIGKEKGASLKSVFYIHIVSIILVALQVFVMIINSLNSQYTPVFISQLFFLPALTLLSTLFFISIETAVILSFAIMVLVFVAGMFRGKRYYNSNVS